LKKTRLHNQLIFFAGDIADQLIFSVNIPEKLIFNSIANELIFLKNCRSANIFQT